jgi:hypothetical protein
MVMTETQTGNRLPAMLDGYAVVEEVTGRIVALKGGSHYILSDATAKPPADSMANRFFQ